MILFTKLQNCYIFFDNYLSTWSLLKVTGLLKNSTKYKYLFLLAAIIIPLGLRLPFLLEKIDFNNDAPTYSRNIEKDFFDGSYDVHLPGYISFIYTGRVLNSFINNPITVQHVINLILVALISITAFYLFRLFNFNNLESAFYTIIFSFINILLLGSLTGGNRLFLALGSLVLISLTLRVINRGEVRLLLVFAAFYAFFIGFRQDFSFYFFPLYLYLCFRVKDFKLILLSLVIFTIVCLSWFVPLMVEYNGIEEYIYRLRYETGIYDSSVIFSGPGLGPLVNVGRIFIYLFNAFLFIIPIFIFTLTRRENRMKREHLIMLAIAFFPALIFQMLVHNGNFVQLAAFMAPLFICLVYSFRITSLKRVFALLVITSLLLFQFFGVKMFYKEKNLYKEAANILWLQYSYDGAKSQATQRLKQLDKYLTGDEEAGHE